MLISRFSLTFEDVLISPQWLLSPVISVSLGFFLQIWQFPMSTTHITKWRPSWLLYQLSIVALAACWVYKAAQCIMGALPLWNLAHCVPMMKIRSCWIVALSFVSDMQQTQWLYDNFEWKQVHRLANIHVPFQCNPLWVTVHVLLHLPKGESVLSRNCFAFGQTLIP